ncbi:hypothetical protein [Aeromicrobium sp. 50.2.37]|uniref:hypothetical protein n=1 Tax=Aeromicrobium sp. 50.2.37 TaxID=2969305 RepID=UPI00214F7C40|nr:hypothetical protein [Aeromicrobium sp. 50.2.37]MCR4513402.1 hypothetical protein [Aeromicrobium sp. 50.2.37]
MKRLAMHVAIPAMLALTISTPANALVSSEVAHIGSVAAPDAEPGIAPADPASDGVYLDENGEQIEDPANPDGKGRSTPATAGAEAVAAGCKPISGRDNPHHSSGDVSGHGWWSRGTCNNDKARVKNCLYEWYTDRTWRLKKCSKTETLKPGSGGSANRTHARIACDSRTQTSWRNHVDVDVNGEIDDSSSPYNQAEVSCRVQ